MRKPASITRRLIVSVLALELLAAIILIGIVTVHERHVQFEAFDANLRAMSSSLLGAVQESNEKDGSVLLDLDGLNVPSPSIFRVSDENGKVLGSRGAISTFDVKPGEFGKASFDNHRYRIYMMSGDRVIDPGDLGGGVRHHITVVYGLPEGRVWHEVVEAVRYFAIATIVLLTVTALLLSWLVRTSLLPIRELANEADKINSDNWKFNSPADASSFTELSPLASAIEKTITRLHRAFEQQRRMTNDAAHELKTDTAIIKSSLQVLTMKRRTIDEYEKGIAVGISDIGRLEQTVGKMLALARLEQRSTSESQSCTLDAVLLDAMSQTQALAEMKSVRLESFLNAGGHVGISSDDASLLCSNILINAIQHSPERGIVHVILKRGGDQIVLTVRDEGQGIHEQDRPYLFDPFYRGDPSRSRKSGGTGLGLAICKAICDRATGSIRIENHSDGGALITVTLPVVN